MTFPKRLALWSTHVPAQPPPICPESVLRADVRISDWIDRVSGKISFTARRTQHPDWRHRRAGHAAGDGRVGFRASLRYPAAK